MKPHRIILTLVLAAVALTLCNLSASAQTIFYKDDNSYSLTTQGSGFSGSFIPNYNGGGQPATMIWDNGNTGLGYIVDPTYCTNTFDATYWNASQFVILSPPAPVEIDGTGEFSNFGTGNTNTGYYDIDLSQATVDFVINCNMLIQTGNALFYVTNGHTFTMNGYFDSHYSANFTKLGPGTMVAGGTASSVNRIGFTVSAGRLNLNKSSGQVAVAGGNGVTINGSTAVLAITGTSGDQIDDSLPLKIGSSGGTFDLTTNHETVNSVIFSAGPGNLQFTLQNTYNNSANGQLGSAGTMTWASGNTVTINAPQGLDTTQDYVLINTFVGIGTGYPTTPIFLSPAPSGNWSLVSNTGNDLSLHYLGGATPSGSTLSITNNGNGTVTLTLPGVAGQQYHAVTTANVTQPFAQWTSLTDSTNNANGNGIWTYTTSIAGAQHYFRVVSP